MIKIVIAGRPTSVNHLYATFKGRRIVTKEGRNFKNKMGWLAKKAICDAGTIYDHIGDFTLSIYYYFKTAAGDIDNCNKALLDSMSGIVYNDDSQITDLYVHKRKDPLNPRTVVYVYHNETYDPSLQTQ